MDPPAPKRPRRTQRLCIHEAGAKSNDCWPRACLFHFHKIDPKKTTVDTVCTRVVREAAGIKHARMLDGKEQLQVLDHLNINVVWVHNHARDDATSRFIERTPTDGRIALIASTLNNHVEPVLVAKDSKGSLLDRETVIGHLRRHGVAVPWAEEGARGGTSKADAIAV